MIRREKHGEFLLITQHDHALLSAELGRAVGNEEFAAIADESVFKAMALHDSGWPLHDDSPTLNNAGFPWDIFDASTTAPISQVVQVWSASVDRAAQVSDYTGLLVSLHVLSLSAYALQQRFDHAPPGGMDPHVRFALNKFQHRQIERQEAFRKQLGLRLDRPLHCGLAKPGTDSAEDLLLYHFHLLQAMDLTSLALCCTKPPDTKGHDVNPRPGESPIQLTFNRGPDELLVVTPWPFRERKLSLSVPFRRLEWKVYADEAELLAAYQSAAIERLSLTVAHN